MDKYDKTVGYKIARDSSRNTATKLLYCTEAIVAMMMQQYLVSSQDTEVQDVITTVIIDEVRNRSAHSDYVLGNKNSQRGFFKESVASKNIFGCFHVLQCVLSRHISPYP